MTSTMPLPAPERRASGPAKPVVARCRGVRAVMIVSGLIGYAVVGLVAMALASVALGAAGVDLDTKALLAGAGVIALVATVLGALVTAEVRPEGLYVRNRWRRALVPWAEIEAIEQSSSVPYSVILFYDLVKSWANGRFATRAAGALGAEVLTVRARGRRLGLPVYATLGRPRQNPKLEPFRAALAAAGHPVTAGTTFDGLTGEFHLPEPPPPTPLPPPTGPTETPPAPGPASDLLDPGRPPIV